MPDPARPALRLPKKLVYTTLGCAIAGVVACSGQTSGGSDASTLNGYDASSDCDGGSFAYCGGGPCPTEGAYYCAAQCPTGCDPFA
jgi:hypothetical protein